MANQNEQVKNTNDQADGKFDRTLKTMQSELDSVDPNVSVRETEDASLPDKEYAFGEDNTDTEEYHDADDDLVEDIFDNEDDLQ